MTLPSRGEKLETVIPNRSSVSLNIQFWDRHDRLEVTTLALDTDDPALTGRAVCTEPVNPVLLLGNGIVVIARSWKHGDYNGLTADRVLVDVNGYSDMGEMEPDIARFFPDVTTSDGLARMVENGILQRIDSLPLAAGWIRDSSTPAN